jgi:hypothetical protein
MKVTAKGEKMQSGMSHGTGICNGPTLMSSGLRPGADEREVYMELSMISDCGNYSQSARRDSDFEMWE